MHSSSQRGSAHRPPGRNASGVFCRIDHRSSIPIPSTRASQPRKGGGGERKRKIEVNCGGYSVAYCLLSHKTTTRWGNLKTTRCPHRGLNWITDPTSNRANRRILDNRDTGGGANQRRARQGAIRQDAHERQFEGRCTQHAQLGEGCVHAAVRPSSACRLPQIDLFFFFAGGKNTKRPSALGLERESESAPSAYPGRAAGSPVATENGWAKRPEGPLPCVCRSPVAQRHGHRLATQASSSLFPKQSNVLISIALHQGAKRQRTPTDL